MSASSDSRQAWGVIRGQSGKHETFGLGRSVVVKEIVVVVNEVVWVTDDTVAELDVALVVVFVMLVVVSVVVFVKLVVVVFVALVMLVVCVMVEELVVVVKFSPKKACGCAACGRVSREIHELCSSGCCAAGGDGGPRARGRRGSHGSNS